MTITINSIICVKLHFFIRCEIVMQSQVVNYNKVEFLHKMLHVLSCNTILNRKKLNLWSRQTFSIPHRIYLSYFMLSLAMFNCLVKKVQVIAQFKSSD